MYPEHDKENMYDYSLALHTKIYYSKVALNISVTNMHDIMSHITSVPHKSLTYQ